jgi:regulator of nucleoside diphosphate kinase
MQRLGVRIGGVVERTDMHDQDTVIPYTDHRRLRSLLNQPLPARDGPRAPQFGPLRQRIRNSRVVNPKDVPRNVVTMNSRLVLRNLDSGESITCTLAYPQELDLLRQQVSVASPLGANMLGKRVGQIVHWPAGAKVRRLRIQQVLYQPEAAGDYHL